ncbi:MAG TPA: hydroxyisourate hydrolase [Polyangiaceae bacterium]|nr:hydroxyisourate hydrolase [Polyangiaceae bacterium]
MTSPLTSHVLDTALGKPAQGLAVALSRLQGDGSFELLAERRTGADGRVSDLLPAGALDAGTYRLRFETAAYFAASARPVFYPFVEIVFVVTAPGEHYHVPLLLSPFGYSTYRGS